MGATGYAGEELIRLLINHPQVEINYLSAKIDKPARIDEIFPSFKGKIGLICEEPDIEKLNRATDVVFLATPHGFAYKVVPELLKKGKKVVDLSADFRLKDSSLYKEWYHFEHKEEKLLQEAVYGLPEIYAEEIKKARLVANPGCYPTGAILAVLPLVKNNLIEEKLIIDAKSGTTGAGRNARTELIFSEVNESMRAYKVNEHQHIPEMEQELSFAGKQEFKIIFVPQLLPLNRGILTCVYAELKKDCSTEGLISLYKEFYKHASFVRIMEKGVYPQLKAVQGTNYCDIGLVVAERKEMVIAISAIDNLGKGAAGQAVQNLNIMMGWEETLGLR